MGMFDSLYADRGRTDYADEWQTKAYWCELDSYFIGDEMPPVLPYDLDDYQVEVSGDRFATVRDGKLVEVPALRDPALPLLNYSGHLTEQAAGVSS